MTKHEQLRRTLEELKRHTAPGSVYDSWLDQALVLAGQIENEVEELDHRPDS